MPLWVDQLSEALGMAPRSYSIGEWGPYLGADNTAMAYRSLREMYPRRIWKVVRHARASRVD